MSQTTGTTEGRRLNPARAEQLVRADERARIHRPDLVWPSLGSREVIEVVHAALAHLPAGHLVADVARRSCGVGHPVVPAGIACAVCWEAAIRADERFVHLFDLTDPDDRDLASKPDYVDEVAVEQFIDGTDVAITPAEWIEVVARLRATGSDDATIVARLAAVEQPAETVARLLDATPGLAGAWAEQHGMPQNEGLVALLDGAA